jgi:hypothetical protein
MELGIILTLVLFFLTGLACYFCWSNLGKIIRLKEKEGHNEGIYKDLTLERVAGVVYNEYVCNFLEIITSIFAIGTCIGYSVFI